MAINLARQIGQLDTLWAVLRFFSNPFLIILLRLGIIKTPLFLYQISINRKFYSMLARPATNSMADLFVLKELFVQQTYSGILRHLPSRHIRFVDVGGNIGAFAVWLASHCEIREGLVFEPLGINQRILQFNLLGNGLENVSLIRAGLGGKARICPMTFDIKSPGGSSLYSTKTFQGEPTELVQVFSFQEWMHSQAGLFDLLKLDCEGAEWEIIEATPPETFRRFAVVVAEVHAPFSDNVSKFKDYFDQAGFRAIRWDSRSHGVYIGIRTD